MQFKPDFATTAQRFEAWWRGDVLARPPVTFIVKSPREYSGPQKSHATQRERWLNGKFQVEVAVSAHGVRFSQAMRCRSSTPFLAENTDFVLRRIFIGLMLISNNEINAFLVTAIIIFIIAVIRTQALL